MYIKEIRCSISTFKTIYLKPGINFIVAESENNLTKDLKSHDKTNSVGKTTILEIIKYCFGQNVKTKPFKNKEKFENCQFSIVIGTNEDDIWMITRKNGSSSLFILNISSQEEIVLDYDRFKIWFQNNIFNCDDIFLGNPMSSFLRKDVTTTRPFDISFNEKSWTRNNRILTCLNIDLRNDYLELNELITLYTLEKNILKSDEVKEELFGYEDKETIENEIENIDLKINDILNQRKLLQESNDEFLEETTGELFQIDDIKLANEKIQQQIKRIKNSIRISSNKKDTTTEDKELIKEFESLFNLYAVESLENTINFHNILNENVINFLKYEIEDLENKYNENKKKIDMKPNNLDYGILYSELILENIRTEGKMIERKNNLKNIIKKYYNDIKISTTQITEKIKFLVEKIPYEIVNNFINKANAFCQKLFNKYSIIWDYSTIDKFLESASTKFGLIFDIKAAEEGDGRSHLLAFLIDICLVLFGQFNFCVVHDSAILDSIDRTDLAIVLNELNENKKINQQILLIRDDNISFEKLNDDLKNKYNNSMKLSTKNKLFGFDF